MSAKTIRSKGDKDPVFWLLSNEDARCAWLSADHAERAELSPITDTVAGRRVKGVHPGT
ncbi:hypothetical protein [Streptomyces clavifer]|uniref:hypothetical protein n=1 Tax=Streptomyces clavifer TaxID=68188 RepID=UPI003827BAC6